MKIRFVLKKTVAFLIAGAMIFGFVSAGVQTKAAAPVKLAVTNATGKAGDEVTISVNISENSGLAAAGLYLKYDNTKLTLKAKSATAGTAAAGGVASINENLKTEGAFSTIKMTFITLNDIVASGSLFNAVFIIKPDWSGSTDLILTTDDFATSDYKNIPHDITNGSVTIGSAATTTSVPGTTNSSGTTEASTMPGGSTTAGSTNPEQTTAVPVTVPYEDIFDALGPDGDHWDMDYNSLSDEQKEKIEQYYAEQGKKAEVKPDGVYIVGTTNVETSNPDDETGDSILTSKRIIIIAISVVCLILAASLVVAYVSRIKKEQR